MFEKIRKRNRKNIRNYVAKEIINMENEYFEINGSIDYNTKYKLKWSLAKDDVTPQDIFRLTKVTI